MTDPSRSTKTPSIRRLGICAVAILSTLVLAAPAQAATKATEVSGISLDVNGGAGSNVFGSVFSEADRCVRGRKVILQAVLAGGEIRNMGHDKASKNGAVNVGVPNDPAGIDHYELLAPKTKPSRKLTCRAARGPVLPA
ncbi:hypothetical protein HJD18_03245 [Thermoleophilia bacterium SCSIO 60948]|nr:hypothetical protein HJD18_03245 [Thermoleophilia bacterium SCSIO 60948]